MYKKLLTYPILLLITLAIFLGYGFIFGGEFPIWLTAPFIFLNVLVLCVFNFRGSKEKPLNKLMMYFIISFVLVFLCVFAYNGVNEIGRTEVDSYEATVIHCGIHRGSYWITFKDPTGEEQTVERFDPVLLSPIYYDDEVIDYYGQKVKIIIYSGLFGFEYLVWDE
jgi:hypothetical protein